MNNKSYSPENTPLSENRWRSIAHICTGLAEFSEAQFEARLRYVADALRELVDAEHLMIVIARRIAPSDGELGGLRPTFSREFGANVAERRRIRHRWMASEPQLHEDPVLQWTARTAGRPRTLRHRDGIPEEAWQDSPVPRLLDQLGVEDRLNAILPINDHVELFYIVDRASGRRHFDEEEAATLLEATLSLPMFTSRFAWRHGVLEGQRQLDEDERHLLDALLGTGQLDSIARDLSIPTDEIEQRTAEVLSKLAIDSRVDLMHAWLSGPLDYHHTAADNPRATTRMVRRIIDRRLAEGDVRLDDVVDELGLSRRELMRQLDQAGESFSDLMREARYERARLLLSRPWLTLSEVSHELGYSRVSSLHRAVKRWKSMTPNEWRDALID